VQRAPVVPACSVPIEPQIQAGHEVTGLARSDASAAAVKAMGVEVRRGDLGDLDGLREAAAGADAVIHLAFDHETMAAGNFAGAVATDLAVVQALGDALVGTGKTLIGIGLTRTGDAHRDAVIDANPRSAVARAIAGFAERGVRTILVAVPPVTHSARDKIGFIPTLIRIARDTGVSGYVGEGANRWPAGHTLDVASLFRLALEKAPAGSQLTSRTDTTSPPTEGGSGCGPVGCRCLVRRVMTGLREMSQPPGQVDAMHGRGDHECRDDRRGLARRRAPVHRG
jgi:nucleoside-diphosphate-sugar epimerase